MTTLGNVMVTRGGSVNPTDFPDEEFELYSIPAHDRGGPEVALGSGIGSSKQIVQPGDVMISRIIPHIRRARVVEPTQGRRQIASGEWIVFRGNSFNPQYLRHYLLSDRFHNQFMNTVAGVGGSLVRARPAQVKAIDVPLPSLNEQRRIAAILDTADEIRAKRREGLAHLDTMTGALFQSMFGGHTWPTATLNHISSRTGEYGANVPSAEPTSGLPRYVRITDITERGRLTPERRAPGGDPHQWSKYMLADGDLLFARSGATVGKAYRYRSSDGPCVFAGYLIRFRPNPDLVEADYVFGFTRTMDYTMWVTTHQNVVAQPNINAKQYGSELRLPLPPLHLQREFADKVEAIESQRAAVERALAADDELFTSLQSRAFRGEL